MCGDYPVVEFFPKYEDLTVGDLPHLVAVTEKVIHEWLVGFLSRKIRTLLDEERAGLILEA